MAKKRKRTNRRSGKSTNAGDNGDPGAPEMLGADGPFPYKSRLPRKVYSESLLGLQIELLKLQRWLSQSGEKVAIVFEGRDAAGKGGTIKRFREHLNPRGARAVALPKPNETERGQWYFQRYVAELPTAGELVFFDRSWYNRAGVEPVMGFCTPREYQQFLHQVPNLERGLVEGGIRLFKLWFDVGREEQKKRIESRKSDPLKQWKYSGMDDESIKRFDAYTRARDAMLFLTDTGHAPWTIVRSDDKRRARVNAIRTVLTAIDYDKKDTQVIGEIDSLIVGTAAQMFPLRRQRLFDVTNVVGQA